MLSEGSRRCLFCCFPKNKPGMSGMSRTSSLLGYSPRDEQVMNINLSYSHCFGLKPPLFTAQILDTGPPNELFLLKRWRFCSKKELKVAETSTFRLSQLYLPKRRNGAILPIKPGTERESPTVKRESTGRRGSSLRIRTLSLPKE